MDAARFDAWTRRRFGIAAGGLVASLLGVAGARDGAAKKKKKCKKSEKRCGNTCVTGRCCPGKRCGGDEACRCGRTIGGKAICFRPIATVCLQCDGDGDCTGLLRCIRVDGCDAITAICLPPCGAEP